MSTLSPERKIEILKSRYDHDLESLLKTVSMISDRMRDYAGQLDRLRDKIAEKPNPGSIYKHRRDILPEITNTCENLIRNLNLADLSRKIAQMSMSEFACELSE